MLTDALTSREQRGVGVVPEHAASWDDCCDMVRQGMRRNERFGVVVVQGVPEQGEAVFARIERALDQDPDLQFVFCLQDEHDMTPEISERHPLGSRCVMLMAPPDRTIRHVVWAMLDGWATSSRLRREVDELRTLAHHPATPNAQQEEDAVTHAEVEAKLRHAALHDPLTGLPNRMFLLSRLRWCMDRLARQPDHRFAVLFIDLDNFKLINDSLGHDTGDRLLISIANRLRSSLRSIDSIVHLHSDTTARLGGDEFVVLLDGIGRAEDAVIVADRLGSVLAEPFVIGSRRVSASASIGIALSSPSYLTGEEMLRDADMAMYRAKQGGKGRHALFDRVLHDEAVARLQMENDLRDGLALDQFRLAFQPILSVDEGGLLGFEALLRWDRPDGVIVGPADFVPIAEEMGLIVPLGAWVMREACRQLAEWRRNLEPARDLVMSVNISRRQIAEPGLLDTVDQALADAGLPGSALHLEITESAVVEDISNSAELLNALKDRGLRLLMDDFGTGLSSLSCLHELPVDVLKIHRSFIMNMDNNRKFAAVVHAILTLAAHLDMKVVAEGVEDESQMAGLIALGADFIQGFHVAKALSAKDAERMIASGGTTWNTDSMGEAA